MSTDFYSFCASCNVAQYLGYRWGGGDNWSFGYGRGDVEGQQEAGQFILDHSRCGQGGVRIVDYHRLDDLEASGATVIWEPEEAE